MNNWNYGGRGSNRGGRGQDRKGFRPRGRASSYFRGFRGSGGHSNNRDGNNQWQPWRKRNTPSKKLLEEAIGVTAYISKHKGFVGIIKSRYSDFQVAEINLDGRVAKLTEQTPPTPPKDADVQEDEELLLCKYNLEILPMTTWDSINNLAIGTIPKTENIEIDATGMSKEQRTKIHDAVKKAFGNSIVGSTINEADKKIVRFEKYQKGVRIDTRVKWVWPGEYVYFIVHKENADTMEVAHRIADALRLNVKPSMLGYAGTKDRRAKTSQWFSMRKVDPRKIALSCKNLRDVRVGNFDFKDKNLRLGDLKGNQFRIALRNVKIPDEEVFEACKELQEKGFLNYYGLQRFGSRAETPTYQIGLKLLQGKFQEAIEDILEVREGPLRAALQAYKDSGAGAALRIWPWKENTCIESRLLRALAIRPKDLLGAMDKLARNTRLLYLHSYQSLVWNKVVTERVRRFGLTPAVGDVVGEDVHIQEELEGDLDYDDEEEEMAETDEQIVNKEDDVKKETQEKNIKEEPSPNVESSGTRRSRPMPPVKILTQEDVDSGKYSIFDIVMPLPGSMIQYPPNMVDYYEELLAQDNLQLDMKHKIRSYSMTGTYRPLVVRPAEMSWRTVRYTDPHCDLILSDWDELQGTTLGDIVEDGKYKALILTMNLPPSCYATMALRELLKRDTSSDMQALQNDYYKTIAEVKDETKGDETEDLKPNTKNEEDIKPVVETEEDAKMEEEDKNIKPEIKINDENFEQVDTMCSGEEVKVEKRKIDEEETDGVEVKKVKQEVK